VRVDGASTPQDRDEYLHGRSSEHCSSKNDSIKVSNMSSADMKIMCFPSKGDLGGSGIGWGELGGGGGSGGVGTGLGGGGGGGGGVMSVERTAVSTGDDSDVQNSNRSLCVLVVDDSLPNRKLVGMMLQLAGHTYVDVGDGADAVREISLMMKGHHDGSTYDGSAYDSCDNLTLVQDSSAIVQESDTGLWSDALHRAHTQYDAILMDSHMAVLGGPEATAEIRALGYLGAIIGLTGDDSSFKKFLSCGADSVMLKPVDLRTLSRALRDTVGSAKKCRGYKGDGLDMA
jgi:CheY-like chemotaxis protein